MPLQPMLTNPPCHLLRTRVGPSESSFLMTLCPLQAGASVVGDQSYRQPRPSILASLRRRQPLHMSLLQQLPLSYPPSLKANQPIWFVTATHKSNVSSMAVTATSRSPLPNVLTMRIRKPTTHNALASRAPVRKTPASKTATREPTSGKPAANKKPTSTDSGSIPLRARPPKAPTARFSHARVFVALCHQRQTCPRLGYCAQYGQSSSVISLLEMSCPVVSDNLFRGYHLSRLRRTHAPA